ncbi:hypothetical protein Dda_8452 [Drechslerella dactyloides]|uniref:Epoxide hydrolase n=1 Tax=Drechslerella dactyloides TaxID=74499 RepID=A0AAD6IUB8_DREDA|nr:hypothetical protein Dda_8452 [Drechslerella dactyloides]
MAAPIAAVLFDIGGVVVRSPLLAIEAYEATHDLPPGYINWNIYNSGPNSAWKKLERNEIPMDDGFFHGFHADLNNPDMWAKFLKEKGLALSPAPLIDAKWLFWEMMRVSREIDPHMLNAIQKLRETRKYTLGALTNNYVFPEGHPYRDDRDIKALFDVYISSAEVGMRKPEHRICFAHAPPPHAMARIFEHAIKALGVESASQIVFLDDLGGNLKAAREMGLNTIKVPLRDTRKAIRQLEEILGEELAPPPSPKL